MRLIDADVLLDAISVHLERVEQEFDDAPTIDSVRHGKWVDVANTEMFDKAGVKTWGIVYQCNQCGFIVNAVEGHIGQYHYCPNCGANMEEVEE